MNVKVLTLLPFAVLAFAALPTEHSTAATLRCRDTLHGYACDSDKGNFEVRCRGTLHGTTCDDNRGNTTRCRDTLHGSDCEVDSKGRRK